MEKEKREGAYFYMYLNREGYWDWSLIKDGEGNYVYDLNIAQERLPRVTSGRVILSKLVKMGEIKFV